MTLAISTTRAREAAAATKKAAVADRKKKKGAADFTSVKNITDARARVQLRQREAEETQAAGDHGVTNRGSDRLIS